MKAVAQQVKSEGMAGVAVYDLSQDHHEPIVSLLVTIGLQLRPEVNYKATQTEGIGHALCLIYGGTFESRGMGVTLECKNLSNCNTWKTKVKEMAPNQKAMEPTDNAEKAKCILKVRV